MKNNKLNYIKKILLIVIVSIYGYINAQTEKGNWAISGASGTDLNFTNIKSNIENQSNDRGTDSNFKNIENPSNDSRTKITNFSIKPSVGYFIIDNLLIGIGVNFDTQTTKVENTSIIESLGYDFSSEQTSSASVINYNITNFNLNEKRNIFSIQPQVTYFFANTNFRPYASFGIGYSYSNSEKEENTLNFNTNNTGVSSSVISTKSESTEIAKGFGINLLGGVSYFVNKNISFDLGLNYSYLNLKKLKVDQKIISNSIKLYLGISLFLSKTKIEEKSD